MGVVSAGMMQISPRSSARRRRSGRAAVRTRLVASPHSFSCISAASTSILAAGCCTSSSFTMVAQSDVTMIFSRWFTTSFFIPGRTDRCAGIGEGSVGQSHQSQS